jgi:hypothetical protein
MNYTPPLTPKTNLPSPPAIHSSSAVQPFFLENPTMRDDKMHEHTASPPLNSEWCASCSARVDLAILINDLLAEALDYEEAQA